MAESGTWIVVAARGREEEKQREQQEEETAAETAATRAGHRLRRAGTPCTCRS